MLHQLWPHTQTHFIDYDPHHKMGGTRDEVIVGATMGVASRGFVTVCDKWAWQVGVTEGSRWRIQWARSNGSGPPRWSSRTLARRHHHSGPHTPSTRQTARDKCCTRGPAPRNSEASQPIALAWCYMWLPRWDRMTGSMAWCLLYIRAVENHYQVRLSCKFFILSEWETKGNFFGTRDVPNSATSSVCNPTSASRYYSALIQRSRFEMNNGAHPTNMVRGAWCVMDSVNGIRHTECRTLPRKCGHLVCKLVRCTAMRM